MKKLLLLFVMTLLFPIGADPQFEEFHTLEGIHAETIAQSQHLNAIDKRLDRIEAWQQNHDFSPGGMPAASAIAISQLNDRLDVIEKEHAFSQELLFVILGAVLTSILGLPVGLYLEHRSKAKKLDEISRNSNGNVRDLIDRLERAHSRIQALEQNRPNPPPEGPLIIT